MNNSLIASSGYSSSTMLDTYITDTEGNVLPFMPATDKSVFVVPDLDDATTGNFIWISGQTAKSSHDIVTGYGGKITTLDNADLEPHDSFVLQMSVYLTNTGVVFEKQDCLKLAYNASTEVLTLTAGNEGTPDYTLTATNVEVGLHTIEIGIDFTGGTPTDLTVKPNGGGDLTEIPNVSDGYAHWEAVSDDDAIPTTIGVSTTNHILYRDLYTIPFTSAYFDSVTLRALISANWGYEGIAWLLKMPGYSMWTSDVETVNPNTAGYIEHELLTNPITGDSWVLADLINLQIGLGMRKDNALGAYICISYNMVLGNATLSPSLYLSIDDVEADSEDLTVTIPDTANDWEWFANPYFEYIVLETAN
jgi:hypothetical protein